MSDNNKHNFYEFYEKNQPLLEKALEATYPDLSESKIIDRTNAALYDSWNNAKGEVVKREWQISSVCFFAVVAGAALVFMDKHADSPVGLLGLALIGGPVLYYFFVSDSRFSDRQSFPEKDYVREPQADGSKKIFDKAQTETDSYLRVLAQKRINPKGPKGP